MHPSPNECGTVVTLTSTNDTIMDRLVNKELGEVYELNGLYAANFSAHVVAPRKGESYYPRAFEGEKTRQHAVLKLYEAARTEMRRQADAADLARPHESCEALKRFSDYLRRQTESLITNAANERARFLQRFDEGVEHALEAYTSNVIETNTEMELAVTFERTLKSFDFDGMSGRDVLRTILNVINTEREEQQRRFFEYEPWAHNSTSVMQNAVRLMKAHAYRNWIQKLKEWRAWAEGALNMGGGQ